MCPTLPPEKVNKVRRFCQQIRSGTKVCLRTLVQLLGLLESYRPEVWKASLHFRFLLTQLIRDLTRTRHDYETEVILSAQSKRELQWWFQNKE